MSRHAFVAAMAKHLPPSASTLRLLDIGGACGVALRDIRADLDMRAVAPDELPDLLNRAGSVDAIVALNAPLTDELLRPALDLLRPGGRFIAIRTDAVVDESWLCLLESHGYIRILVEAAVDGQGVLLRGERAHATSDTLQRINIAASADANLLDLNLYRRPYMHLLIQQRPNRPVWQMRADETISWRALAIQEDGENCLIAFSSLPKAVAFMQPAALLGMTLDINKVGKFERDAIAALKTPVQLNPTLESIDAAALTWLPVDPASAAAPDE